MESAVVNLSRRIGLGYLFALLCHVSSTALADKIEAVKGKKYELSRQNGPWMIMVVSLAEPPPEYRADGPGPAEAAAELVFELRKKNIPAYVFEQKESVERLSTFDRNGKTVRRGVKTKDNRICVVAGNYPSAEDSVAQKTLAFIKNFKPTSFADHAVFRSTPGRPGPLSGAFLTLNPLLSSADVAQRKLDPLLLQINGDRKYSLLSNRGKYTLVVASFYGRTRVSTQPGGLIDDDSDFGKAKTLDEAGRNAEILCQALRESDLHHQRKFDAFVWHEREKSLVCVGNFSSEHDPMIPATFQLFAEHKQEHAITKIPTVMPQSLLVPEPEKKNWIIPKLPTAVSRNRKVEPLPRHTFAFDPKPQLMPVPLATNRAQKDEYAQRGEKVIAPR